MASVDNSGLGHGSQGSPQTTLDELTYPSHAENNDSLIGKEPLKTYKPSPKHEPGYGWGNDNPIKNSEEGQKLLDSGYPDGRQVYNVTSEGKIVKFQPDHTPENGYHAYEVSTPRDIPSSILRKMLEDGVISKSDYNKYRKGKKGRR